LRHEKKVWRKQNEMIAVVSASNKQKSQPLNWLCHHIKQDQDDVNGFSLFVWDMKQRLIAVVA
jgi:hypothetical protein